MTSEVSVPDLMGRLGSLKRQEDGPMNGSATPHSKQGFGTLLKQWRRERRMSQLDLGLAANVSARHIAFLETERARPSRVMVLQLSETMRVPLAARNSLLTAAGFAELYRQRTLSDAEMLPIRAAVAWMLERHHPYPAIALDRHWRLVTANQAASRLFAAVGVATGDSLLDVLSEPGGLRAAIENWPEVARHFAARLRMESSIAGGDPVLMEAAGRLATDAGQVGLVTSEALSAVLPTRLRLGDTTLSLFSTIAQFSTAEDIALADLKIELMFPADDATRLLLVSGA
jgi:transcriptional regulator with XRE-family HTH domain